MRVNDLLRLEISELALGGKALARHEGRVVFVDRGLPGDLLVARVTRVKPSYAEARMTELERPSPNRVEARCPHVSVCGGCRFQDLAYPADARRAGRDERISERETFADVTLALAACLGVAFLANLLALAI